MKLFQSHPGLNIGLSTTISWYCFLVISSVVGSYGNTISWFCVRPHFSDWSHQVDSEGKKLVFSVTLRNKYLQSTLSVDVITQDFWTCRWVLSDPPEEIDTVILSPPKDPLTARVTSPILRIEPFWILRAVLYIQRCNCPPQLVSDITVPHNPSI